MAAFSEMRTQCLRINSQIIREHISHLTTEDSDSLPSDFQTRSYYYRKGDFLWITRHGVDERADTVLKWIGEINADGFSLRQFRVDKIRADLVAIRNLKVDTAYQDINYVLARLEYNLTKAYLRYVTGQRFGYVNPNKVLNRLDIRDSNETGTHYRQLFDIKMDHPDKHFYHAALDKVRHDSVTEMMTAVQPKNPIYWELKERLPKAHTKGARYKILCNMERARWRTPLSTFDQKKYVLVNIPSFHLQAVDGVDTLVMRIGCGTFQTKTPLLTSSIKRMDINPQWIVPRSIIEKDIIRHAGDLQYFKQRRFFLRNRKNGQKVFPSWEALADKDNMVIQEGGEGNSLGRIIFRFNNPFAVYLHHTSSPGVFSREDRGVSHGCIRVEKPFELAAFLLGNKKHRTLEKIRYSMNADVSSLGKPADELSVEQRAVIDTLRKDMLIGSVKIEPEVPIFLTYFTLYPKGNGDFYEYADVYGYDRAIMEQLKQIADDD